MRILLAPLLQSGIDQNLFPKFKTQTISISPLRGFCCYVVFIFYYEVAPTGLKKRLLLVFHWWSDLLILSKKSKVRILLAPLLQSGIDQNLFPKFKTQTNSSKKSGKNRKKTCPKVCKNKNDILYLLRYCCATVLCFLSFISNRAMLPAIAPKLTRQQHC